MLKKIRLKEYIRIRIVETQFQRKMTLGCAAAETGSKFQCARKEISFLWRRAF